MKCMCIRTEDIARRFICDRTDDHPGRWGSDEEGHHWVEATEQQWQEAMAALFQAAITGQHRDYWS